MGCCVLFPQHIPCTCSSASLGNGERSRWVQVSVPTGRSALKHFRFHVQLHTHLRSTPGKWSLYLHVQRSRAQRHSQCLSAGGKLLAVCTTRTGTAPKPTVGTAQSKDGEDLALLQHLGSLGTLCVWVERFALNPSWLGIELSPTGGATGSSTQHTSLPTHRANKAAETQPQICSQ